MKCQQNSKFKTESSLFARMLRKTILAVTVAPLGLFPLAPQAQMSTNMDALPPADNAPAKQPENAGGFSNNYSNNYNGGNAGGDGIVSSQQAQQAADNLGLPASAASSGYSGAAFPPRQGASSEMGESSPPAPKPQKASMPKKTAPYENGITPVRRAGTTVIPPIPPSPPPLILAPPFPSVTIHPPVDPEPVLPVKGAISDTRPLANSLEGIRVEFAPLKDDMDQETIDAISRFGKHMAHNPRKRLLLEGFSGAQNDDPSLPRRLSLQRLLKIRSLLMRAGVASTRIYPKTIGIPRAGTHETNGPQDRVDIYPEENPNELIPDDDALARAQQAYPSQP